MLDRDRPYGYVFGDTEGRTYEQDGKFYDALGRLIEEDKPRRGRPLKSEQTEGDAQ